MQRKDPLLTVLKLEKDAEEQAALQLRSAQLEAQKRQTQLNALNEYRLDYMKQMDGHTGQALSANHYHQFHRFIKQVDEAIGQQVGAVREAETQVGYRQKHWQEKQQKRKAVEMLLDKKRHIAQVAEDKREQKASDEFATQQYFRNKNR
ncbi:flagellar export protein FliJ [Shewanella maritima]|uniref:flagellar export protein FliJ n=1 Tax=Shewanella maritima TaxID=2520507 RepID=UPI0037366168